MSKRFKEKEEQMVKKGIPIMIASIGIIIGAWSFSEIKTLRNDLNNKNTALEKRTAEAVDLQTKIEELKAKNPRDSITEELPNGRTITYPNTEGNRRIIWWASVPGDSKTPYVVISNKLFQEFMAETNNEVVARICGTASDLKALQTNIPIGVLNTDTMELGQPQNPDCVHQLATDENTDDNSRKKAKATIDQVEKDINDFLKTIIISH